MRTLRLHMLVPTTTPPALATGSAISHMCQWLSAQLVALMIMMMLAFPSYRAVCVNSPDLCIQGPRTRLTRKCELDSGITPVHHPNKCADWPSNFAMLACDVPVIISDRKRSACSPDIQPVLSELAKRNMSDSPAAWQALESLQGDVKRASVLVDLCKKRSRIYLLLNCRSIVEEAEQISRDIAKSLALLWLATTEVAVDIRNNVDKLSQQMLNVEFQASE